MARFPQIKDAIIHIEPPPQNRSAAETQSYERRGHAFSLCTVELELCYSCRN